VTKPSPLYEYRSLLNQAAILRANEGRKERVPRFDVAHPPRAPPAAPAAPAVPAAPAADAAAQLGGGEHGVDADQVLQFMDQYAVALGEGDARVPPERGVQTVPPAEADGAETSAALFGDDDEIDPELEKYVLCGVQGVAERVQ